MLNYSVFTVTYLALQSISHRENNVTLLLRKPIMKVKTFVVSGSLLFAVWLGGTFVRNVPLDQYPLVGANTAPLTQEENIENIAPEEEAIIEVAAR